MCSRNPTIVKLQGGVVSAFRARCRSWSCPECSPRRRAQLIEAAREGSPNRFITLTVNPGWFGSPAERAAALSKAWRLTVAAFRHKYPSVEAEYLAVFEATRLGEPHLHIVWRGGYVPQRWLAAQMRRRMGAPVVDVRRVRGQQEVARYVAKYISKRAIRFGECKRYWMSKRYLKQSPRARRRAQNAGAIWGRSPHALKRWLHEWLAAGFSLTFDGNRILDMVLPPGRDAPPGFFLVEGALEAA